MGTVRRFGFFKWVLRVLEHEGVQAYVECISGNPQCGAEPENASTGLTPDAANAWMEYHFRATGHRRYSRVYSDTVQWDPVDDVDPRNIKGVTT